MSKIRRIVHENLIFVLITVTVILVAFICKNFELYHENPFDDTYELENPVRVAVSDKYRVYVLDSSNLLAITNDNNEIVNLIYGGDYENTFQYAHNVVIGTDGNFYVHDKCFDETGSTAVSERIIKFSKYGISREIIFEADYTDDNSQGTACIDYITFIDNVLHFAIIKDNEIEINKYESGAVTVCNEFNIKNANLHIRCCAFNSESGIMVVYKNGDVYFYENSRFECVFKAREHDTDEYSSIIAEIGYGEKGEVYLNDVGQRKIYVLLDDKLCVAIDESYFLEDKPENFPENPIYSGMYTQGDTISVLSTQYRYDKDAGEGYLYNVCTVSASDGKTLFYDNIVEKAFGRRVMEFAFWTTLILLSVVAVYSVVRIAKMLRGVKYGIGKLQVIAFVLVITITILVTCFVFENSEERYIKDSVENLSNVAYLIAEKVDKDALIKMDSPDDYDSEEFYKIDKTITEVLNNQISDNENIYCVLYKAVNNIVCQLYSDDYANGPFYPLAGAYEGSIEESIALNKSYYVSYETDMSEGSYTYVLTPIYDGNGEILAFVEVGMDHALFLRENGELFKDVLLLVATAVIIVMLLFTEIVYGVRSFKERKSAIEMNRAISPDVVRTVSFFFFFVANLTTAFLPIHGLGLWNESFPMQKELAAAFPLSIELVLSAVTAFVCGFLIRKTGIRRMAVFGAVFYVCGNLFSIFAGNLNIFFITNGLCGIGGGMLMMAINTWITCYEDEENQKKGFIHYNAACLAGVNCGTVVGSLMWEKFGTTVVFSFASICSAVLIGIITLLLDRRKIVMVKDNNDKERLEELKEVVKTIFSKDIIKFFICLLIPYLIGASFLSYFFPVVAESNRLSGLEISTAFLVSGVISIYASAVIGELTIEKLGTKKSMILASFIYAIALIHLAINPTIINCYVVIVLFAVADSFGMSAQAVYYAGLPGVKKIGNSKALGVNNTIEAIASALGPVIFGGLLMMGTQKGISLIASVFIILLLFFVSTKNIHKNKHEYSTCKVQNNIKKEEK